MKLLSAILIAGIIVLLAYQNIRLKSTNRMKAELHAIAAETTRIKAADIELARLKKLFPIEADVSFFIENMYQCAQASGIKNHEVSTVSASQTGKSSGKEPALKIYRVKASFAGNYRNVAEYIRMVQNIERFKRISSFEMKSENGQIMTNLTLELFSL